MEAYLCMLRVLLLMHCDSHLMEYFDHLKAELMSVLLFLERPDYSPS